MFVRGIAAASCQVDHNVSRLTFTRYSGDFVLYPYVLLAVNNLFRRRFWQQQSSVILGFVSFKSALSVARPIGKRIRQFNTAIFPMDNLVYSLSTADT